MTTNSAPPRPREPDVVRHRGIVAAVAIVIVLLACATYLVVAVERGGASPLDGIAGTAGVKVIDLGSSAGDEVAVVHGDDAGVAREPAGVRCQRYYAAGGTSICLRLAGVGPTFEAAVSTSTGAVARTVPLPGVPSRARVSASGRLVAWTVFISGHSYSDPGGFSTRAGILDLTSGTLVESLEEFTTLVDGAPYSAADRNFWGITLAGDDRTFYATMSSAGQRWLVRGDLFARTVETMRKGVECPSLSPDGSKIAFKAPTTLQGRWRLAVLDLASGRQHIIAGTDGIDDQAAWLDGETLAYGVPSAPGGPAIFRVRADGTERPELWLTNAASPVPSERL